MALRSRLAAAAIVAINLSSRARAMAQAGESGNSWELPKDGFCRAGPMLSTLHPCRNPTGSSGCDFFFFNSSMHLFFSHDISEVRICLYIFFIFIFLGYVFKSIISDNHAGQIRWRSYLVGSGRHFRCPDWSTAPSVYSSQTTDLRTIWVLKTFHWHLPIRARKPQGQTCRVGLNRLEESPEDHSGAFFQGVIGDQIFQQ